MLNHWITRSTQILDCVDSSQIRANHCPAHLPWRRPQDFGQPSFCAPWGQRGRRGRLGAVVAFGRTVGARCFRRFPKRLLGRASPAPCCSVFTGRFDEGEPGRPAARRAVMQRPRTAPRTGWNGADRSAGSLFLKSQISWKDHTEPIPSSASDW